LKDRGCDVTHVAEKVRPVFVARYLKGVYLPATRHDLVNFARGRGAPPEVLSMLEQMPERSYDNAHQIGKGVGEIQM
jgi:hypothetical protein